LLVMFIARELIVHAEFGDTRARLARIVGAGGLAGVSRAAYEDGLAHLVRVGPFGDVPGVSKLVIIRFLDPVYRKGTMRVALRWEAMGAAGGLFPVLDADLSLSAAGEHSARLGLCGCYRPPLGRVGAALDTAVLRRVAVATIDALLRDVADAVATPAAAPRAVKDASLPLHLAPEPGVS
jgi:hypothetical protein